MSVLTARQQDRFELLTIALAKSDCVLGDLREARPIKVDMTFALRATSAWQRSWLPVHRKVLAEGNRGARVVAAPAVQARNVSTMATVTDLGLWKSPVTSELITSKTLRLAAPRLEADGSLYWLEGRPLEGGRQVLVRR